MEHTAPQPRGRDPNTRIFWNPIYGLFDLRLQTELQTGFYPGFHVRGGCKQEPGGALPSRSLPSLPLPFPPLSLSLEVGPLNSARGLGKCCKLTQLGLGRSPSRNWIWCILALKYDIWCQQFLLIFHIRGCQLESRGFTPPRGGLHQSHIRGGGCQLEPGGLHPPRGSA